MASCGVLEAFGTQQLEQELARRKRAYSNDMHSQQNGNTNQSWTSRSNNNVQRSDIASQQPKDATCQPPAKRTRMEPAADQTTRVVKAAPYKAEIKSQAKSCLDESGSAPSDTDPKIMKRVQECLSKANHSTANPAEADAAMRQAARLMEQYNISRAEIFAKDPSLKDKQIPGASVVRIGHTDSSKSTKVLLFRCVEGLGFASTTYFDVAYFTQSWPTWVEFTFYGVPENTISAASAFEMLYNVSAQWGREEKCGDPQRSYLIGFAREQQAMAETMKKEEESRAKQAEEEALAARIAKEEIERQAQLERLKPLPDYWDDHGSEPVIIDLTDADDGNDQTEAIDDGESTATFTSDETFHGFGDD